MSVIEMRVPTIGESISEVTLSQWLKENGEYVNLDEPICEFESDKATLEFPAEASGKLIYVAAEGDDLEIGALVAKIDTSVSGPDGGGNDKKEEAKPAKSETAEKSSDDAAEKESYATGHPSPAASKILKENDVNPAAVQGTGKDGRITKEDAQKAATNKTSAPAPEKKEAHATRPAPSAGKAFGRESSRKKMSRMRRTIAKRLVSAKNETAMLTTFNEADMTGVFQMRKKYQDQFVEKFGIKLGFMSIFSKACAKVLMEMPDVNAQIDGDELVYHEYADISIAISTPNGLVVPPVKNVESLSLADIEWEIKKLAEKARNNDLTLEEMSGGTFTITNGGVFGSLMSTPIINEPQAAILGMHAINERPMAINGQVEIRPMMYLALSYDHRIIDGSTSVTFLKKVKELIEDPVSLLLDL
ncbi:MAG: 2-oxoglutarate dehydrogenase complex dihydrolipoyllysine-residue succinyltransferase [Saprospiraceae bacterium]|nr:2-oxoglutarate dehydrogenase complex dihydrolipoyllysine-residue succinyltransferase [Saprospiraceae bacterium]